MAAGLIGGIYNWGQGVAVDYEAWHASAEKIMPEFVRARSAVWAGTGLTARPGSPLAQLPRTHGAETSAASTELRADPRVSVKLK